MTIPSQHPVILAAVAFDETGERALLEAAHQAQMQKADLHVVHVASGTSDAKASDESVANVTVLLKARLDAVQVLRAQKVTAHIRTGPAARSILQAAADIDADLIVVGTHKRSGVEKLVLGSVAERVLRDAHCPVLVAMPKDYVRAAESDTIEPVCPDCKAARQASANPSYWCERHSRSRPRPHVYEPAGSRRPGPLEL